MVKALRRHTCLRLHTNAAPDSQSHCTGLSYNRNRTINRVNAPHEVPAEYKLTLVSGVWLKLPMKLLSQTCTSDFKNTERVLTLRYKCASGLVVSLMTLSLSCLKKCVPANAAEYRSNSWWWTTQCQGSIICTKCIQQWNKACIKMPTDRQTSMQHRECSGINEGYNS